MDKDNSEKRRFPRVHFRRDFGASDRITKAFAHWRSLEVSDVFDLSLGGLAASKPAMMDFSVGEEMDFTLELGDAPGLPTKAKVAWVRDFSVGLSFVHFEPEGHLALRKFLSDKLIGSHLKEMNPDLYPENADFDLWYSGPKETHLFLTLSEGEELPRLIRRAEIVIDGERLLFETPSLVSGSYLRESLVQILTHAPEDYVQLHTLLGQILKALKK